MIDFDEEKFAQRLKSAVKMAGGNKSVAEMIDINLVSLSRYVTGKSSPTAGVLAKIASACDVSTDYLLYGKQDVLRADTEVTEHIISEAGRIASLIAEATNKVGKFDYDPNEFGRTFSSLLKHSLEVANKEEMGVIIDFEMKKKSIR